MTRRLLTLDAAGPVAATASALQAVVHPCSLLISDGLAGRSYECAGWYTGSCAPACTSPRTATCSSFLDALLAQAWERMLSGTGVTYLRWSWSNTLEP
jgi:hypothetical protein